MNTLAKAFIVVNLVLGVVFLSVSCVLFAQQENWKAEYNSVAQELESKSDQWQDTADKYDERLEQRAQTVAKLQREKSELQTDITSAEEQISQLKEELSNQKNLYANIDTSLTNLKTQIEDIQEEKESLAERLDAKKQQLEQAREQKLAAQEKAVSLEAKNSDLDLKVDRLTARINELNGKLDNKQQLVAAYKKAFPNYEPEIGKPVAPPIDAMVEAVSREEGIVVLSVGAEDKVQKGFTFHLHRDANYVGQVEVEEVYPTKATARIKLSAKPIKPGDAAKTRLGTF